MRLTAPTRIQRHNDHLRGTCLTVFLEPSPDPVTVAPSNEGVDEAIASTVDEIGIDKAQRTPGPVVVVQRDIESDRPPGKTASFGGVIAEQTHLGDVDLLLVSQP